MITLEIVMFFMIFQGNYHRCWYPPHRKEFESSFWYQVSISINFWFDTIVFPLQECQTQKLRVTGFFKKLKIPVEPFFTHLIDPKVSGKSNLTKKFNILLPEMSF